MTPYLGLIGVLVGAGATFAATYFFELRREKRDVRGARKIMESEIDAARRAICDAKAGDSWPPGWHNARWSESWSQYRSTLAAKMNEKDFQIVADAYLEMELLQAGLADKAKAEKEEDKALSERDKRFLAGAAKQLAKAEALFTPSQDSWSSSLMRQLHLTRRR
jgi:hypothetical protein